MLKPKTVQAQSDDCADDWCNVNDECKPGTHAGTYCEMTTNVCKEKECDGDDDVGISYW